LFSLVYSQRIAAVVVLVFVLAGLASSTVPIYIAECAPSHQRGKLVTVNNIFITGGQFVASIVAGAFSHDYENGWRYYITTSSEPALAP